MHKIFTTFIMALVWLVAGAQNYTLYSTTNGVKVISGNKTVNATKGQTLKPNDVFVIPNGGSVSIHDKKTGDIYTSQSSGQISVAKLKIEASKSARSKGRTLLSSMAGDRFGSSGGSTGRIYMEKGMVNRSLAVYDPDGDSIAMQPRALAEYIVSRLMDNSGDEAPLELKYGSNEGGGLFFSLENTLDYPVYFNVMALTQGPVGRSVQISPLGQPNGSYVVLPRQTLHREHLDSLPFSENHFIVITPCQYDLDGVIEEVNKALASGEEKQPEEEIAASVVMFKQSSEEK